MTNKTQDTDAVKDYFTREAGRFDAIYDGANRSPLQATVDRLFRTRVLNARNDLIASLVDEGARCFEIGCGSGRTAIAIARNRNATVHGIDLAGPMIELARRLSADAGVGDRCTYEIADFDTYTTEQPYDVFVAVGVLDYFADPLPMLRRAAQEIVPGGSLVFSWPAKRMVLNPVRSAWLATKKVPVTFYDDGDVARIAGALGGRVVRTVRNGLGPLTGDGLTRIDL